jgi:hypothetical protein
MFSDDVASPQAIDLRTAPAIVLCYPRPAAQAEPQYVRRGLLNVYADGTSYQAMDIWRPSCLYISKPQICASSVLES